MTQRWRWHGDQTPKHVAMTTWETSPLPEQHASSLSEYDAIIVPSQFCAEVTSQARSAISSIIATNKVHVVPHCFDEAWWPMPTAHRKGDPVRFLSLGAWGERKNMLGVLRAYLHAFTKSDRVQLMLVIGNPDFDEIRSVIARSGLAPAQLPEIFVPEPHELSEHELVELHEDADAYVSATRGEGWGLGMFEAAILGKQVIAPLWGGQADFLEGSALHRNVPGSLTPCFGRLQRGRVIETDQGMMQSAVVALPPGVDCKQVWFEPDLSVLAEQMRAVYTSKVQLSDDELTRERSVLEARFGYRTVGAILSNTLKEIAWGSSLPPSTH
jgi:glycosyltransferase involved in cell wall biosynthesis